MINRDRSCIVRLMEAQARIPGPAGEHTVTAFRRGSLDVALPVPLRQAQQTPHAQDEIYFVVRGRGVLLHDKKRDSFEAGDLLFVAAEIEHQTEDTSSDFAVWRVFYGPPGGEVAGKGMLLADQVERRRWRKMLIVRRDGRCPGE